MYSMFLLGAAAFLASLLLTPLVRNIFRKFNVVDHPEPRKIHQHPIPRVGGIAVMLSYLLAYGVLLAVGLTTGNVIWSFAGFPWQLMPAALVAFGIGLVDDLLRITPWQKLLGQTAAAVIAYASGVRILALGHHDLNHWLSLPVTLLWLLACTNAFNLIDGMDGLAAGVGLFATFTTLLAGLVQKDIGLTLATIPLAGALLGFLRFNFNPATIFLGDSGSLFVGFLLGCFGILWSQKSATILGMTAPLMALAIPLVDTGLAIGRRFLHGKPIFSPDRQHIHHRLLDRGFTPRRVALLLYGACAIGAICALGVMNTTSSGLVIVIFCAATWIGIQHLGYIEFGVAGRMFMEGAFLRQLSAQVDLTGFEQALGEAATLDDCWQVIREAAETFGYHQIRAKLLGHTFDFRDSVTPFRSWSIRVPLAGDSFIELSREFGRDVHVTAITPFVESLRSKLEPKLESMMAAALETSAK